MLKVFILVLAGLLVAAVAALAGVIAFGTAEPPPPIGTLRTADATIGAWRHSQPPVAAFTARDGTALAYRRYDGRPGGGLAVLVHGSSGSAIAAHGQASALAARGVSAIALDIRGHGQSGRRGDIEHAGQLLEDMADLLKELDARFPGERRVLVGHSSGGGFALQVAGSPLSCGFQGYVALSPYIGFDAPTVRRGPGGTQSGGWAKPFLPRIVGLIVLRRLGISLFEDLPTVAFAVAPDLQKVLTTTYSFRLMLDFGLEHQWEAAIRRIDRPVRVLVGAEDELFIEEEFAPLFARLKPEIPVTLLPGINHMGIVLDPAAQAATAEAVLALLAAPELPGCRKP